MARSGGVNDRQPAMAQADLPTGVVKRARIPHAFIVTAAMLDALQHGPDAFCWFATDYSCNAAHVV
jgi:hypothetical protein